MMGPVEIVADLKEAKLDKKPDNAGKKREAGIETRWDHCTVIWLPMKRSTPISHAKCRVTYSLRHALPASEVLVGRA
jgi:hypothetical protein